MNKYKLLTALIVSAGILRAEEDGVFLSLTRSAEPLDTMPTNVSVLDQADLEAQGAATVDEGLGSLPSVLVQKSGTLGTFSTLRLRGSPSSGQSQILVDGVPFQGVSFQFTDASQIPVGWVDRVEVVRGGASVLYGPNTIGGAINIITRRPTSDQPLTRLRGEFRSFNTQLYEGEFGRKIGAGDVYVAAGRALSDGFQDNQDSDSINATGKAGYSFGNGARITADLGVVDGEVGNPKGTLLPVGEWDGSKEREALDPDARVEQRAIRGQVTGFVPLGETAGLQAVVHGLNRDYETRPRESDPNDYEEENQVRGTDLRLTLSDAFTLGGSFERDVWYNAATAWGPERTDHVTNVGAYAQANLVSGSWRIIPAVRYDDHSYADGAWNPRLTVVVSPAKPIKLSANASRSFRVPSFMELYSKNATFTGNPNLEPEKAWSYDAGFELGSETVGTVSLTGFFTKIENHIAAEGTTFKNVPTSEISGAELESAHRLPGGWSGEAAYTYTRSLGNTGTQSRYTEAALTPRHAAYYALTWLSRTKWGVTNTVRYTSRQYEKADRQGLDLPPYAVWNARVTKHILAADLYVAVDNILNRRYAMTFDAAPLTWETSRNPHPGRTFWLGASLSFLN